MILPILIGILLFAWWKLSQRYRYWTDRNVKQGKQIYLFGDNGGVMFRKESFFDMNMRLYKNFPGERYFGMYQGTLPTLVVRDPELIKQIAVKEFDHFLNHRAFMPDGVDPVWSRNLFSLKDAEWREMRSTLSPSFTSSKMKVIFSLMTDCAETYVDHFAKQNKTLEIELKETTTRYTNDVIASVAFGVKCNSIKEKENDFYVMGTEATNFTFFRIFLFFFYSIAPELCRILKLSIFPAKITNFFVSVIQETIKIRETQGITRPDLIHLLLEARKGKKQDEISNNVIDTGFATVEESSIHTANKDVKKKLSDTDIAAQALVFFFAGFDSVSVLMYFMSYELAKEPSIQRRLQDEIDATLEECGGKITYEALMKMKYLDMIVSETLRKWPSAIGTDRVCTKPFTIEPATPNETPVHLNPGDVVFIPICGIHLDPKYYPNPEVFDPERFSDENKADIKPYTYMPFGIGPRNCIGSRFAILETKTLFFYVLSKFNLTVIDRTQIPIKLSKKKVSLIGEKDLWLGLEPRSKGVEIHI